MNTVFGVLYVVVAVCALFGVFGFVRTRETRLPLPTRESLGGAKPQYPIEYCFKLDSLDAKGRKTLMTVVYGAVVAFYAPVWALMLAWSRQATAFGPVKLTSRPIHWLGWGMASDGVILGGHIALMLLLAVTCAFWAVKRANWYRCADDSWYYNDSDCSDD